MKTKTTATHKINTNSTLYIIEAVCIFLIIEIHTCLSFPNQLVTDYLYNFSRVAVPLFFMISGYFAWDIDRNKVNNRIQKRFIRNLKLVIIVIVFYVLLNILMNGIDHLYSNVTFDNLFYFFILNWTTPFCACGHIWFLLALLYDYVIMLVINRYNLYKAAYYISILILIAVYCIEVITQIFDLPIKEIYYRNFIFLGFPMIMLGNILARYKEKIIKLVKKAEKQIIAVGAIGGAVILFLETILFKNHLYVYLGSYIFAILGMVYSIMYPYKGDKHPVLVYSGGKCVKWIYVFHYCIILLLNKYSIHGNSVFVTVCCISCGYILISYFISAAKG